MTYRAAFSNFCLSFLFKPKLVTHVKTFSPSGRLEYRQNTIFLDTFIKIFSKLDSKLRIQFCTLVDILVRILKSFLVFFFCSSIIGVVSFILKIPCLEPFALHPMPRAICAINRLVIQAMYCIM